MMCCRPQKFSLYIMIGNDWYKEDKSVKIFRQTVRNKLNIMKRPQCLYWISCSNKVFTSFCQYMSGLLFSHLERPCLHTFFECSSGNLLFVKKSQLDVNTVVFFQFSSICSKKTHTHTKRTILPHTSFNFSFGFCLISCLLAFLCYRAVSFTIQKERKRPDWDMNSSYCMNMESIRFKSLYFL